MRRDKFYSLVKQLGGHVSKKIDWFFRLVRIAGACNPASAVLLQFQSEMDSIAVNKRLDSLQDPISSIHDSSYDLCKCLYDGLVTGEPNILDFSKESCINFSRPLAMFETKRYLKRNMVLGYKYATEIELTDPSFALYLGRKFANQISISELYDLVENCEVGESIDGIQLSNSLNLPLILVRSLFQIYQENGLGLLSNESGTCNYRGVA